jgi:ABC-type bacteriocin/lantibiotic exporter with double-glycine peptidase domain
MSRPVRKQRLSAQLGEILRLTSANPFRWIAGAVLVSLILAALDTIGVAAMIPLTELIAGGDTDSGSLRVISEWAGTTASSTLIPLVAGGIAVIFVVKSVMSIAFRWWLLGRTSRVTALLSTELMRRYMLAPYAAHRTRERNEVYRNIMEATGQASSVLMAVLSLVTDFMLLAAITIVLALTAPVITLATVLLFGVFVLGLQRALRNLQSRIGEEIAASGLEAWGFLLPALDGFREARLTSSARVFVDGYQRSRLRGAEAGRKISIVAEAPRYVLEIGFIIAIAGISIVLFTTGTPGQALTVLGVFGAAALRALPTLNRVAANFATVRTGEVGLNLMTRAIDQLDSEGAVHDETPRGGQPYSGDIDLRNVTFRYLDSDVPVIDALTLTIEKNRTTAFVGSSGAGKSTLLDLILGLLEPTSGTIECGGRSILDDRATWYAGLGVVPQDVYLVNDSLKANVAFGIEAERIDIDRVRDVVALAQLDGLIAELPDGLDTRLGERGVRLSGGQRQRIGLARALYRRPRVLVLDEATSALDNATEREITETLTRLKGTVTIIIVAHRLSTVRNADRLVFLSEGRIDAEGTFAELRTSSAEFNRLVELGDLS